MTARLIAVCLLVSFALSGQNLLPLDEKAQWTFRFFPVALVTGVKAEIGHRSANGYEFNFQGKYIYQGFLWYRTYKSQLPTLFYKPSEGFRFMASYEKRGGKNDLFTIGPKVGYEFLTSDPFDASNSNMLEGQSETVQIERQRYTLACIGRMRTKHKGFHVELSAELGLSYNESTSKSIFTNGDSFDSSQRWDSYITPHVLVGFAFGFGI